VALDIEHVRQIAERVTSSQGLELVEVEFRGGGGKARMLRLYIDKPGGVTHEDCAGVSREVGTILDVEDAMPGGSYTLEVSSPGLDRKLLKPADYERFAGSLVKLQTRQPVEGNRFFQGRLQGLADGRIRMEVNVPAQAKSGLGRGAREPRVIEIELSDVEKANLVPEI
jgi:ribosome maturation factor RimP